MNLFLESNLIVFKEIITTPPPDPGEPVPEENFWTFMVQGKINRGRHRPSGWAPLHPD